MDTSSTEATAPVTPPEAPQPRKSIGPTVTKLGKACFVLSGIGMLFALIMTYLHFSNLDLSWCNTSIALNCEAVIDSPFMTLFGIPGSVGSLIVFITLFVITRKVRKPPVLGQRGRFSHQQYFKGALIVSGIGTLGCLYTTYIQAFVLMTWCIPCVLLLLVMLAIFICNATVLILIAQDVKERQVCEFC